MPALSGLLTDDGEPCWSAMAPGKQRRTRATADVVLGDMGAGANEVAGPSDVRGELD